MYRSASLSWGGTNSAFFATARLTASRKIDSGMEGIETNDAE
jgi:hypothetical protein